jgi:hypothetical protein
MQDAPKEQNDSFSALVFSKMTLERKNLKQIYAESIERLTARTPVGWALVLCDRTALPPIG